MTTLSDSRARRLLRQSGRRSNARRRRRLFHLDARRIARRARSGRSARRRNFLRRRAGGADASQSREKYALPRRRTRRISRARLGLSEARVAELLASAKAKVACRARDSARGAVRRSHALRFVERDVLLGVSRSCARAGQRSRAAARANSLCARSIAFSPKLGTPSAASRIASAADRASMVRSTTKSAPASALLDAYEATLDPPYFDAARRAADRNDRAIRRFHRGGLFRPAGRPRRRSAASTCGENHFRIRPRPAATRPRRFCSTGSTNSPAMRAIANGSDGYARRLRASIAPEYGLHAATYGLAALLHARGASANRDHRQPQDDPAAQPLEERRQRFVSLRQNRPARYARSRCRSSAALPPALAETLPHVRADVAQALVCVGTSCQPPVSDPQQLKEILSRMA
jgi:hypothetical protein